MCPEKGIELGKGLKHQDQLRGAEVGPSVSLQLSDRRVQPGESQALLFPNLNNSVIP